jgi:outer membrane protein TolC
MKVLTPSLVCSIFSFFTLATSTRAADLTLKDAISLALENSPSHSIASETIQLRKLEHKNAIFKLLPSLDFTATHGLENNLRLGDLNNLYAPNTTAPYYSLLNLSLTENLYDNGVSLTAICVADLNRNLAELNYKKTRDLLIQNLAIAYYQYSFAKVRLDIRNQQRGIIEKQYLTLTHLYREGLKPKNDFLRLKAKVQQSKLGVIEAQSVVEKTQSDLLKWIGAKDSQFLEDLKFRPVEVDRTFPITRFLGVKSPQIEISYEYRASQLQNEINSKNIDLAHRRYWPQVFLTSSVSYFNMNYINSSIPFSSNNTFSWNALLSLQFNLWDWGMRKRDIEMTRINVGIQEKALQQTVIDTYAKSTALAADSKRTGESYELAHELLQLEEESYRNLEVQYREGKVAYLDLMFGLQSLIDAKLQFSSIYFEALQIIAQFYYLEGTLYETLALKI